MKLDQLHQLSDAIDVDDLVKRCMGNMDFAERILRLVLDKGTADIGELELAVERSDAVQAAKVAHRLKGALSNGAARRLSQRADEISRMAGTSPMEEVAREVSSLRAEWSEFAAICQQIK